MAGDTSTTPREKHATGGMHLSTAPGYARTPWFPGAHMAPGPLPEKTIVRWTWAVLLLFPWAGPVGAATDLQAVAQIRRDLFGQWMAPAWTLVRVSGADRRSSLDALAAVEGSAGLGRPLDPDLYLLQWSWAGEEAQVSAGRLRAVGALRPQTLDGLALERSIGPSATLETWAGVARHQDLADLLDGSGMGRVGLRLAHGALRGRVGLETEVGPQSPFLLRQDAEGVVESDRNRLHPRFSARAVLTEPIGAGGGVVPEWLEAHGSVSPWAGVQTSLHARHRQAADPTSLFGDALLEVLAGGAVQEVGAGVRLSDFRASSLSLGYSTLFYERDAGAVPGHAVDIRLRPPAGGGLVWVPSYRYRSGPGGSYHALAITESFNLGDATRLDLQEAVVPFQKVDAPQDVAASLGLALSQELGHRVRLAGSADLATDAFFLLDARGGLNLEVLLP